MLTHEMYKNEIECKFVELIEILSKKRDSSVWDEKNEPYLQELVECLIRIYAYKRQDTSRDDRHELMPCTNKGLRQTDAAIFADKLLEITELEIFELQMWRSLGSNI